LSFKKDAKSVQGMGYTLNEFAHAMLKLQNKGYHNINLVTPTYFTPQIVSSLIIAEVMNQLKHSNY